MKEIKVVRNFDNTEFVRLLNEILVEKNGVIGPVSSLRENLQSKNFKFPVTLTKNDSIENWLKFEIKSYSGISIKPRIGIVSDNYKDLSN